MKRKLIFICSPYRGDIESNIQNARNYCRFAYEQGGIPFAIPHRAKPYIARCSGVADDLRSCPHASSARYARPPLHLLFTQFLDDSKDDEREAGLCLGLAMLERCDELWAFGTPTPGMVTELEIALKLGKPVRRFDSNCQEATAHE